MVIVLVIRVSLAEKTKSNLSSVDPAWCMDVHLSDADGNGGLHALIVMAMTELVETWTLCPI